MFFAGIRKPWEATREWSPYLQQPQTPLRGVFVLVGWLPYEVGGFGG